MYYVIGAALFGTALLYLTQLWHKRQLKPLAKSLWENCEEVLREIDPSIYRRPTRFQVYIESRRGVSFRRRDYRILVVAFLTRKEDLPRVRILTERCIGEFLELKDHETLTVRSYYTDIQES